MFVGACFFILQIHNICSYKHQKPLAHKLWDERCSKNSVVLNDCNWCWCDIKHKYQCKARICEEIDMFGHFKDAIRDIDVGMEGRGSWRSSSTPCTPGNQYRRGDVLCLCDEDGYWPNPVCRDLFRVLHSVELLEDTVNQSCTPTKLYLVGCNVCFCSSGYLDEKLCTEKDCQEDDPALPENRSIAQSLSIDPSDEKEASEVYAKCDPNETYDIGCRSCLCLQNNRLICNNCSESQTSVTIKSVVRKRRRKPKRKKKKKKEKKDRYISTQFSLCEGKYVEENFDMGCNVCFCDELANMYCTPRNCFEIEEKKKLKLILSDINPKTAAPAVVEVEPPALDELCIPRTMYRKDCNTCVCLELENKIKVIDCSLNSCSQKLSAIESQQNDCVIGKAYMMNCRICYCYTIDGVKHQVCQADGECPKEKSSDLKKGYCQPLHKYKKDCNTCRCLSDGKTLMCSSKVCSTRTLEPLAVDLVPVQVVNSEECPKGYSYKLGCNLCFCLSNGNALCTTSDCSDDYQDS